ncbi:unnamed protein product [Rotaria sordida]|uniref:Uncharacterized protein n=1 Tax=Rotaria sordida TaxID=392033 RepID=A0A819AZW3_9BILA|nr:unnamed protein product [Rotaria sordida]CAF3793360.1 unnamed protein product [Rotaria sordida]CAF3868368.1 unnamed protein product [Rotaria sordida]
MSQGHKTTLSYDSTRAKGAVQIIERAWCRHRDRQMFRLLKHAVCAAEHALSNDILRRLSPREAELLRDRSISAKVKFRFGGVEFPPVIYFKIYVRNFNGALPKYVNGKTIINADMNARIAACKQMGQRVFYQQMLSDSLQGADGRASDEIDVVTLKDYMQYSSLLDELPSYLGGRANNWRRLNLEGYLFSHIFVEVDFKIYIESGHISPDLRDRIPMLLTQPNAHSVQLQHIELLKQIKSAASSRTSRTSGTYPKKPLSTVRRSRRAIENASKMRQAYIMTRSESLPTTLVLQYEQQIAPNINDNDEQRHRPDNTPIAKDEFNDGEVDALYAWTEQLEWNEDLFKTDRISTA